MRVLLSTYGSRGDVEPMVGLALRLRTLDAEVRVRTPPDKDFAELLARVGAPLVPGDAVGGGPAQAQPSWSPRSSTRSPRDVMRWWRATSRSPTASRCGRNISSGATEDAV